MAVLLTMGLIWAGFEVLGLRFVRTSHPPERLRQAESITDGVAPAGRGFGAPGESPRNVILFVADGLGFAHLSLARAVHHGLEGPAAWDRFPITGWQRTQPRNGLLTESAAAATALATGYPTSIGAIAVDADGKPLRTLFERASELGYRTGVVTDSYVWDATPAAFLVHSQLRGNDNARDALRQLGETSLEILVGELEDVGEGEVPEWEPSIDLLGRRFEVLGPQNGESLLETLATTGSPVAAIFEEDQITDLDSRPALPELVAAATRRLSSDDRPFLLLVECEEPDSASHDRDLGRLLRGMQVIDETLDVLLDFASNQQDTLLVFTSDHETGGLALSIANHRNYELEVIWATEDHTGVAVPLLAFGPGSEAFSGIRANWEVGQLLMEMLTAESRIEK